MLSSIFRSPYCWLLISFIHTLPCFASTQENLSTLYENSETLELSKSATWLKLLVTTDIKSRHYKSAITSDVFFLSKNGKTDSKSELHATIKAFLLPISKFQDPNDHPQCKFQGRWVWLNKQLHMNSLGVKTQICSDFNEWAKSDNERELSIIYATGYLGNPASYYGHAFIKVGTKNNIKTNLEDLTINFGAAIDANDGLVKYISKGLFGNYNARFSDSQYFYQANNYGEVEFRNLWELKLDLTKSQKTFLLAHSWELLGKNYRYFFLNRNCAHRMAELLEIIDGVNVIPTTRLWSIPQAFIQNMEKISLDNKKLVRQVVFHPSRQSRYYEKYIGLTSKEKNIFRSLIFDMSKLEGVNFNRLSMQSKTMIVDTLLDYYQYILGDEQDVDIKTAELYKKVLLKRFKLPASLYKDNSPTKQVSPLDEHRPSYASIGVHSLSDGLEAYVFKVRPAYYDMLDKGYGQGVLGSLSMGELEFAYYASEKKYYLRKLDVINIESIRHGLTNTPGDTPKYWSLKLGFRPVVSNCEECLSPNIEATAGKIRSLAGEDFLAGIYAGGGLQKNILESNIAYAKVGGFLLYKPNARVSLKVELSRKDNILSNFHDVSTFTLQSRFKISDNIDLRAGILKYKNDTEYSLSIGRYW